MTDSGGPLARVSYLPGAHRPPEQAPPAAAAQNDRDDEGWYVEPSTAPPRRGPVFVPTHNDSTDSDSTHGDSIRDETLASVRPLASASAPVAPVPFPESPAIQKMRALVESAAAAAEEKPHAATRRAYSQKASADEAFDDDEAPLSTAELAARAERISMNALTRKGMSSWEMTEKLRARDLDDETIANEVARLERVGLLNDFELAETLVRTLQDRKGLGRSGITAELRRRHVDQTAIDEALDALDSDDEAARALEIALKRAPQLRSLDSATAHRRLSAFLMRKGYSGSVISAAVAGALEPARGPRFR